MRKVTVKASSDVALIKYWGKKDEVLRLPSNSSVSLITAGLDTITTVEFLPDLADDDITIQGEQEPSEAQRASRHLDRIRQLAGFKHKARVVSHNSFPKGTGLSSSGSGFGALTVAAAAAAGLDLSAQELSILARQGSGTACRCVIGGFVQWLDGDSSEASYSVQLFPAEHWDLRDVIAVVDEGHKKVSSTEGHQAAHSSPFFKARLSHIADKIEQLKRALANRDFAAFGSLVEAEALEFHSILLTSQPPLIAWYPGTIAVMQAVQALRESGVPAYFTINTGFNVHVLTLPKYEAQVQAALAAVPLVQKTLTAQVGSGPQEVSDHLF